MASPSVAAPLPAEVRLRPRCPRKGTTNSEARDRRTGHPYQAARIACLSSFIVRLADRFPRTLRLHVVSLGRKALLPTTPPIGVMGASGHALSLEQRTFGLVRGVRTSSLAVPMSTARNSAVRLAVNAVNVNRPRRSGPTSHNSKRVGGQTLWSISSLNNSAASDSNHCDTGHHGYHDYGCNAGHQTPQCWSTLRAAAREPDRPSPRLNS
jgi:hypothetical protein